MRVSGKTSGGHEFRNHQPSRNALRGKGNSSYVYSVIYLMYHLSMPNSYLVQRGLFKDKSSNMNLKTYFLWLKIHVRRKVTGPRLKIHVRRTITGTSCFDTTLLRIRNSTQYYFSVLSPEGALWGKAPFSSVSGISSKPLVNRPRGSLYPAALHHLICGCSCTRSAAASEDFHLFLSPMGRSKHLLDML